MDTPNWVKDAVFYQIFPDRFAKSGRVDHHEWVQLKPWGTPPEEQGFHGGDLYGIVDRLDYLEDLGVTALYLNPIFASAANHRYHTYDYFEVDPLLGGNDALRALLTAAHNRGMRIVLDGVFNHASRGFWPFHHVLENGSDSPYVDWFHIHDWPLRPYAPDTDTPHNYAAWANIPALPELNTDNPEVRRYLLDVAEHWIDFGIDGWRLDVPNEIDDDAFWQAFRDTVKSANPEAYIVGEIWHDAQRWLQGDQFDAVMNYPFLVPVLNFTGARSLREYQKAHLDFQPMSAEDAAEELARVVDLYDWDVTQAQLNLLDSHDMARALWIVGDDVPALRLAVFFQMTMPGAPCIYYGDEVGMSSPGDPYCREAFPWDDRDDWDEDLLGYYRDVVRLRHDHAVLRTGRFEVLHAADSVLAFRRFTDEAEAVVIVNAGREPVRLSDEIDAPTSLHPVWPRADDAVRDRSNGPDFRVPARSGGVWVGEGTGT